MDSTTISTQDDGARESSHLVGDTGGAAVNSIDEQAHVTSVDPDATHAKQRWMEAFDDNGHVYYVNLETMETSWELPVGDDGVALAIQQQDAVAATHSETPQRPSTAEQIRRLNALLGGGDEDESSEEHVNNAGEPQAPASPDLDIANAWAMFVNDADGTPYYYNHITEECVWEAPPEYLHMVEVNAHVETAEPVAMADGATASTSTSARPSLTPAAISSDEAARTRAAFLSKSKTPVSSTRSLVAEREPSFRDPNPQRPKSSPTNAKTTSLRKRVDALEGDVDGRPRSAVAGPSEPEGSANDDQAIDTSELNPPTAKHQDMTDIDQRHLQLLLDEAAVMIQCLVRCFLARRRCEKRRVEQEIEREQARVELARRQEAILAQVVHDVVQGIIGGVEQRERKRRELDMRQQQQQLREQQAREDEQRAKQAAIEARLKEEQEQRQQQQMLDDRLAQEAEREQWMQDQELEECSAREATESELQPQIPQQSEHQGEEQEQEQVSPQSEQEEQPSTVESARAEIMTDRRSHELEEEAAATTSEEDAATMQRRETGTREHVEEGGGCKNSDEEEQTRQEAQEEPQLPLIATDGRQQQTELDLRGQVEELNDQQHDQAQEMAEMQEGQCGDPHEERADPATLQSIPIKEQAPQSDLNLGETDSIVPQEQTKTTELPEFDTQARGEELERTALDTPQLEPQATTTIQPTIDLSAVVTSGTRDKTSRSSSSTRSSLSRSARPRTPKATTPPRSSRPVNPSKAPITLAVLDITNFFPVRSKAKTSADPPRPTSNAQDAGIRRKQVVVPPKLLVDPEEIRQQRQQRQTAREAARAIEQETWRQQVQDYQKRFAIARAAALEQQQQLQAKRAARSQAARDAANAFDHRAQDARREAEMTALASRTAWELVRQPHSDAAASMETDSFKRLVRRSGEADAFVADRMQERLYALRQRVERLAKERHQVSDEFARAGILASSHQYWQARIDAFADGDQDAYWTRVRSSLRLACASEAQRISYLEMQRSADGDGLLHAAVWNGWMADVAFLLDEMHWNVNAVDNTVSKCTPLHEACRAGRSEMVRLLLEHGAALDAVDAHGDTAMHIACRLGWLSVVRVLISAGQAGDRANLPSGLSWRQVFQLRNAKQRCAMDVAQVPSLVGMLNGEQQEQRVSPHAALPRETNN